MTSRIVVFEDDPAYRASLLLVLGALPRFRVTGDHESPLETIDDPQVVENGYLAPHPTHPTARVACAPMQFDDERITIRRPAPGIGEHTEEVLAEAGFSDDEIAALHKVGAAGAA